jgi:hypothetical protein
MSSPFDWRSSPSKLAEALKPHAGNTKPGAPITLRGTNHGGAYTRPVPLVTEEQARGMDSTFGGL